MSAPCPFCGEDLPEHARFCGSCGRALASLVPGIVVCPLCRTELPDGARFCGSCGQSLDGTDSLQGMSRMSLPPGMYRVQLVHGPTPGMPPPEEAPSAPPGPAAEAPEAPAHAPSAPPAAGYVELADSDIELEESVNNEDDVEQADASAQRDGIAAAWTRAELSEVDAFARRGKYLDALRRLLAIPSLPADDPRLTRRLARLGREMGQSVAARGRSGKFGPTALRSHLLRLLRLTPDLGFRENLRLEIAPVAAAADMQRVRDMLAEGHLSAAIALSERVLALGPKIPELRTLVREVIRAVVKQATAEQRAGDAALRKGDGAAAERHYLEALQHIENDRLLLARVEQARAAGKPGRSPARKGRSPRTG